MKTKFSKENHIKNIKENAQRILRTIEENENNERDTEDTIEELFKAIEILKSKVSDYENTPYMEDIK